jgi:hypothetical protein
VVDDFTPLTVGVGVWGGYGVVVAYAAVPVNPEKSRTPSATAVVR